MRIRLALTSILALLLGAPVVAHAQAQLRPCMIIAGQSTATCASEATLAALLTYLETGQSTTITGNMSQSGLIAQMSTLNSQLSSLRKQAQQDFGNEDVRNRALASERAILGALEQTTRPINRGDCRAVAGAVGALGGGGGGGGVSANTAGAAGDIGKQLEGEMTAPGTENDYIARLVSNGRMARYCTQADVNNKLFACGGAVGTLPGANNDPSVLIRAATNPGVGNFSIPKGMENPQYAAAIDYIRLSAPFPAPRLREAAKDTPMGRAYLIKQRRYNSRMMAVIYGLSTILAESIALPAGHPFVANVWNGESGADLKAAWAEVNKGIKQPTAPSEREMMHLLVNMQFANKLASADLAGPDEQYFARRSLELDKLNAYLTLKLNEKSEWSNIMLAHILSNDIDPVSLQSLKSEAAAQ